MASLLRAQHHHLPSRHPHLSRKFFPRSIFSSLSFLSLPLPTASTHRGSSLVARAELPDGESEASVPPPSPKQASTRKKRAGFGGGVAEGKKKRRGGKERSAVIRRSPVERPSLLYSAGKEGRPSQGQQQGANESAFLLTWLGLGLLILVEGIALAASGFLPEEWDNIFVKYLYPSFTPTVFLFVGGTVAYGVFKYLQGEKMKS